MDATIAVRTSSGSLSVSLPIPRLTSPADGYYEWLLLGPKEKQPYAFTVGEDSTFAFAGLWDAWHDKKTDQWLQSFAILTISSNELTRAVHPRMPVILRERDYDEWLLRDHGPPTMHLLQSFPAAEMRVRPGLPRCRQCKEQSSRTA